MQLLISLWELAHIKLVDGVLSEPFLAISRFFLGFTIKKKSSHVQELIFLMLILEEQISHWRM